MLSLDPILNLFIGLALTFGSFSLLTGAMVEAFASALGWRAATLEAGLRQMLNDPKLQGLAKDVLAHAAVNPLSPGAPGGTLDAKRPTYIEPAQFAAALTDVLSLPGQVDQTTASLQAALARVENPQLRQFLDGLLARAKGDVDQFRSGLAAWFDSAMDRLSGGYKRKVQAWNFCLALALAGAMNVDALTIARQLWVQPGLSGSIAEQARRTIEAASSTPAAKPMPGTLAAAPGTGESDATADPEATSQARAAAQQELYDSLYGVWSKSLPFGWANFRVPDASERVQVVLLLICGWVIAASSTVFGAPFWFDTLQKLARIRSSGLSPREAAAARGAGQPVVKAGLAVGAATTPASPG
ncbi:hypothetical protein ACFQS7_21755 [Dankookia sp. GCM10030260]|uniref:hypothetical protein n=1 Tax=Dankookia sp. GCM10030260 TaxID=3273390 RepID=UPI00361E66C1